MTVATAATRQPSEGHQDITASLSVVVPVYQNEGSLPGLLERLRAVATGLQGIQTEFVFVDDGSTDQSYELLSYFARQDPSIRVIGLSRNFGSNPALLALSLIHISEPTRPY